MKGHLNKLAIRNVAFSLLAVVAVLINEVRQFAASFTAGVCQAAVCTAPCAGDQLLDLLTEVVQAVHGGAFP